MTDPPPESPLLFVSYAHEDKELCRRWSSCSAWCSEHGAYDVWWDETIMAGPWRKQIERPLARAAAGLLLVPPGPPAPALTGHRGSVWAVAWSPDGRRLASGGADGAVRVWTPGAPDSDPLVVGRLGVVGGVVAHGTALASGGDRTVRVWDLASRAEPPVVVTGHEGLVWSVAWSPDGRRLASGSSDRNARVWNADNSSGPVNLTSHQDHVWSVAWSRTAARWSRVRTTRRCGCGTPTSPRGAPPLPHGAAVGCGRSRRRRAGWSRVLPGRRGRSGGRGVRPAPPNGG